MRRLLLWLTLLVLLVPLQAHAGNSFGESMPSEMGRYLGTGFLAYIVTGCAPTVPSSSLTFAAFACTAMVADPGVSPPRLRPVIQAAATVTVADTNGIHWLAVCQDQSSAVSGWNRRSGTHYMHRQVTAQPADPAGCLVFAEVTVAGNVITVVRPALSAHRGAASAEWRAVNVMRYATGGIGTAASPWTGWAAALPLREGGTYVLPEGWYQAAALDLSYTNLSFIGLGAGAVLDITGSGNAVTIDAGSSGAVTPYGSSGIYNVRLRNLIIKGNASTTNALYLRGVHHSNFDRVSVVGAATTGDCLEAAWIVANTFLDFRCSENDAARVSGSSFYVQPDRGIYLTRRGVGENATANIFVMPIIEGLGAGNGNGIYLDYADKNTFLSGTSENNITGIRCIGAGASGSCLGNTFESMFFESNSSADVIIVSNAEKNTLRNNQMSSLGSSGSLVINDSADTIVEGGQIVGDISIGSGSTNTMLRGFDYRGALSNSSSSTSFQHLRDGTGGDRASYTVRRDTNGSNAGNFQIEGNALRKSTWGLNDTLGANGKAYIDSLINATPIPLQLNPSGGGIEIGASGGAAIKAILEGSNTNVDVAPIADGAQAQLNVTVTGAALGDYVMCSASQNPGAAGFSAIVSGTNTVTITFMNQSGGSVDPGLADYRCLVFERP